MNKPVTIDGYAIVSDDHCIADADGNMPNVLKNDADWAYFQAALDAATLTIVGRKGHEANPNVKNRRRLILSRSLADLEHREDGWWWNPAGCSWPSVLAKAAPEGGAIAVPGGRDVFDLFLKLGYSSFHLARAEGAVVPGGTKLFSQMGTQTPEELLVLNGLITGPSRWLDKPAQVSMAVWQQAQL